MNYYFFLQVSQTHVLKINLTKVLNLKCVYETYLKIIQLSLEHYFFKLIMALSKIKVNKNIFQKDLKQFDWV